MDAGSGTDGGTAADICRARAEVVCHAFAACETSSGLFATLYASEADCAAQITRGCLSALPGPSIPGHDGLDIFADDATCTAALAKLSTCEAARRTIFGDNSLPVDGCFPSAGTFANGATCFDHRQCASSYCKINENCGVCADRVAAGSPCVTSFDCNFDVSCVNGVCRDNAVPGGSCSTTKPCTYGFACQGGTCQPLVDAGSPCTAATPCEFGYCSTTGHVCTPIPVDRKPGDLCGVDTPTGAVIACGLGAVCKLVNTANQGICAKRVEPYDRCFFNTGFQGGQCEAFSQCLDGVCTDPTAGLMCSPDGGVNPPHRDGGQGPVDGGTDVAAALALGTSHLCDALFTCTRTQGFAANVVGSRTNCESQLAPIVQRDLGTPDLNRTLAGVQACNAALDALDACSHVDALAGSLVVAECQTPGVLGAGSPCVGNGMCAAGTHCTGDALVQGCGICTTVQGDGGMCISNDECAKGLACANERCVPAGALTDVCSGAAPCDRALTCQGGHCAAPGAIGDPCSPTSPGSCLGSLFCNGGGTCEQLQVVGLMELPDGGLTDGGLGGDGGLVGQTCGILNGKVVLCPYGTNCKLTNAQTRVGFCDDAHLPGEACAWSGGLDNRGQCRFPAMCINGVCSMGDPSYCQ
jgi:hypothetical protein